jgi:hypothetical protein
LIPAGTGLRKFQKVNVGSKEEYEKLLQKKSKEVTEVEAGE